MALKFHSEDNGNCRVYYRDGKRLFCWQDEGSWGRHDWQFYVCSSDGEPSHHVKAPDMTPPPLGDTNVGRDLSTFLSSCDRRIADK